MTIESDRLDGADATFQERFVGPEAEARCSEFLLARSFALNASLFFFLADTAIQPDTRIVRYRKMSKRPGLGELVNADGRLLSEGFEEFENGLLCWSLCRVTDQILPEIVRHLRADRGSFLFLSQYEPTLDVGLKELLKWRGLGRSSSIDQGSVVSRLVAGGCLPVRVWGPSGDRELWAEIHGQFPTTSGSPAPT